MFMKAKLFYCNGNKKVKSLNVFVAGMVLGSKTEVAQTQLIL